MEHIQKKIKRSILSSILVLFSGSVAADINKNDQVVGFHCSIDTSLCLDYIKGYLDVLYKLDQSDQEANYNSFEERALRTHLGKSHQSNILKDNVGCCLPRGIDAIDPNDILSAFDTELLTKQALLQEIKKLDIHANSYF